jgi:hypothetical protein
MPRHHGAAKHGVRAALSLVVGLVVMAMTAGQDAEATSAPEGARVYFINLEDGMEVTSPFRILIGLENMGVAPANMDEFGRTGHHHLLVNVPLPGADETIPERKSGRERYIHLGGGQTQVTVDLPDGEHELQLLMGDHEHVPHEPVVKSRRISVEVVGAGSQVCKPLLGEPSSCEAAGD